MTTQNPIELETVESLIDKHGADRILEALREVCYAKAEHVETNWQDKALASRWIALARISNSAFMYARRSNL